MARRRVRRTKARKTRARATRPRRAVRRTPASRKLTASTALAQARSRIAELELEIRRLREELAAAHGEPLGGRSDPDDTPLAPGM